MFAVYPVLLPLYLMRYDWKFPTIPEPIPLRCIVQAHSKDALVYFDIGTKEAGGLLRKTFGATTGSLLHRFSHAADNIPAWDSVSGTEYGFSSIGIPNTYFDLGPFNKTIAEGVDEKILSKSNMAALAEYGVDMDDSCVRVYTKEEVDANRKFLVASGTCYAMRETLRSVTVEKIKSGAVKFEVYGKRAVNPEALLENMKKQALHLENQREELKPQWLRDQQDLREEGQSGMPP